MSFQARKEIEMCVVRNVPLRVLSQRIREESLSVANIFTNVAMPALS